ncbi:hypothetical protein [Microbacterium sp. NPDC089696]|uniref:hypothetical protein n=1 Tax=Microbacterium sp. NPDC089696 TaxID=3364199 RepID=UPI00380980AA
MAGINPGRNAGRLSIRVIPNTNDFRRDLKRRLDMIERTTTMTVTVNKAKLDGGKIREDIRRQLVSLKDLDGVVRFKAEADVQKVKDVVTSVGLTMDRITIDRLRRDVDKAMRGIEVTLTPTMADRQVRRELDALRAEFHTVSGKLAHDIMSAEDAEMLRHRLNDIKDHIDHVARNRETRIDANPFTAWASARLAWLTRPRTVEVFVKVSKASVVAALTTLSALSGARLSWKWIDDLATSMKNLDKNLPSIINWTTGITSLIASIFAATSGLVGIGQGLFSILPAFLVVPGLILNGVGSLTALVVALRNAKTELGELSDDMSELGGIINDAFWTQARQPILDLVNGLMPQLRTSFDELSTGIGQFTGELAKAFGEELGNGGLESIFTGIAEGWRILSTGAPAFAGAMTSLSQVAAKYTPRLATWFVRQANTFDTWLEAVSTDGRLDGWMENAIKSMYDLWDATTGIAGVFKGLWTAADSAGSKGLAGFADMMQEWDRIVNGADFQRGLTAIFRGASTAMTAFGGAVRAIGRMILGLDTSIEKFLGSAGKFFGGLIEGAANALNQPAVGAGLDDLSDGLIRALEGILPHLPTIAATFGSFLGLLGDLAGTLLPAAASVLAELMPSIQGIIDAIRPILPELSEAVISIAETLGPPLADFVSSAAPLLAEALVGVAAILKEVAPVLSEILSGITEIMRKLFPELQGIKQYNESKFAPDPNKYLDDPIGYYEAYVKGAQQYAKDNPIFFSGYLEDVKYANLTPIVDEIEEAFRTEGRESAQALWEEFKNVAPTDVVSRLQNALEAQLIQLDWKGSTGIEIWKDQLQTEFSSAGLGAARSMWDEISAPMSADTKAALLKELGYLSDLLTDNMTSAEVMDFDAKTMVDRIEYAFKNGSDSSNWLYDYIKLDPSTQQRVLDQLGQLRDDAQKIIDSATPSGGGGGGFSRQLAQGIRLGLPELDQSVKSMKDTIQRGVSGSEFWLTPNGTAIMGGLKAGMDGYKPTITADMAAFGGVLSTAMASAGSWLYPTGMATMAGMQAGAQAGRGGVIGAFGGLQGAIGATLAGAGGWFYGVGAAMMQGIARGIGDNSGGVSRAAASAVDRAVNAARAAGDIHSPSRRTNREIGLPLVQGIAVGITKGAAGVRRSMVSAIDFSGLRGESPTLTAEEGTTSRGGVSLHIHNPITRDLQQEAWEAAQLVGQVT